MKIKIPTTKEVNITHIELKLPMRYGDEDVPYDFPLRKGDIWTAMVNIDTGTIRDWPTGKSGKLETKVCDEGTYFLFDEAGNIIADRQGYVPNGVVPGRYGDYVELDINSDGIITNWPKKPDVSEFFKKDEYDV